MTEVGRDVRNIWKRLFDHTHFLNGEINFMLNEFELRREDKEVNELFLIVENLTESKDTEFDKLNKILDDNLVKLNEKLTESLSLSKDVLNLEAAYKDNKTLENSKQKRKIVWQEFMDDITERYSEINTSFEKKENNLREHYTLTGKQPNYS